jgi:predicted XRE-type DNA-binding protein
MPEPIRLVAEFLGDMIDDAESRVTGRGSILDYGMRIRRQTAEDVLRYVQQLTGMGQEMRTWPGIQQTRGSRLDSGIRLKIGPTAGFGQAPGAPTGIDATVRSTGRS